MDLSKQEIRDCVVDSIREILPNCSAGPITDQTNPILDLGLDSLDGILVAGTICEKLKFKIPPKMNPFLDDGPPARVRSVGEIVTCLLQLAAGQETQSHA